MKVVLALLLFLNLGLSAQQVHVILCGGPALRKWEDLRVKPDQHDRYWANFVHSTSLRSDELRKAYGYGNKLIWLVYKDGYVTRGREDGKPYTTWIAEQAAKRKAQLVWIDSGDDVFRQMNAQRRGSIITFDFFGHSNKYCFLLDYSNEIMASCKAWIHEKELSKLKASVFDRNAICQSYGCHTGESMSAYWKQSTGVSLIGARGKTDYTSLSNGKLPFVNGSWVR
ncbi:MAG: hypothetical protein Q7Q71_16035 [Verrucomicrobiota bacterium JB023]|nr:hypothetical protein [Verrucomicrobiota bacterium JB023]